jgi:hypothetical protein
VATTPEQVAAAVAGSALVRACGCGAALMLLFIARLHDFVQAKADRDGAWRIGCHDGRLRHAQVPPAPLLSSGGPALARV